MSDLGFFPIATENPNHLALVSPDGQRVATCGNDHLVKLWDAATGMERLTLVGHSGAVRWLAWASDDVVNSGPGGRWRWDVVTEGHGRAHGDGAVAVTTL
jgi:WD40 repeat protein